MPSYNEYIKIILPPAFFILYRRLFKKCLMKDDYCTSDSYFDALFSCVNEPSPAFPFEVGSLVYYGGMNYSIHQHHFLRYYKYGKEALEDFYKQHRPKSVFEEHFLKERNSRKAGLPWFLNDNAKYIGEHGLDEAHGKQQFGPVSDKKIALEARRLDDVLISIQQHGYQPRIAGGYPRGYLIKKNQNYRFVVVGGQHRVAAMVHLGYKNIHVAFQPGWPRLINEIDCIDWPLVRNGIMSRENALEIFDAYWRPPDEVLPCFAPH